MINTIILDLDGTLLNCQMRHYQCYFNILVEHGYVPMTMDSYWLLKRNRSDLEHLLGRSNATVFRDQFKELWLEQIECRQYLKLDQVYPLVMETLCNWKSLGIRLILSTLRNHETDLSWQLQPII
jgi:beta-phosphoglucomutase-like phosphatase (HAD superfamily)